MDLSCKTWENPGDMPFNNTLRNKFVRGAPAALKSSMNALLCRTDHRVRTAVTQVENLNAIGVIGAWGGKGQVMALNCKGKGGYGYLDGQQGQSSNQNSLTKANLWC